MAAPIIAIVDYGAGNLASVARALEHLGYPCEITGQAERIRSARAVILPGVGAAGATMANLCERGLDRVLKEEVIGAGKPFLGICIGIQVLLQSSAEGNTKCLGVVRGSVRRFPPVDETGRTLKVPQIGWNRVHQLKGHPVFDGVPEGAHFYFVNSYYAVPDDSELVIASAQYGVTFAAAIARGAMLATQFHLEKSGAAGLKMLDNFCRTMK